MKNGLKIYQNEVFKKQTMPFDPNSEKKVGKKSKKELAKKEVPSLKQKMEMLYEKVLDDLLVNKPKIKTTFNLEIPNYKQSLKN